MLEKQEDSENCKCWIMLMMMSQERASRFREHMRQTLDWNHFSYWNRIQDGDQHAVFWGEEKECRKLAKELAKDMMVAQWRLIPSPKKSSLYKGGPAYREDADFLLRANGES